MADLLFELCLLLDQSNAVDTFVHADGVLPVVRTLGVLRVVLDAHGLVGPHVTEHDVLLHLTRLVHRGVLTIATLLDAIARQVTAGGARIANGHRERAGHVTLQTDLCPFLRFHRHVVLRILRGTARLRIDIDAEHAEVAGLAWPHPVVGLATELTHRLGQGEYQAHVGVVAIGGQEVLVPLVEGLDLHAECRVLFLDLLQHGVLQRVKKLVAVVAVHPVDAEGVEQRGDIFLLHHERHEEVLVG